MNCREVKTQLDDFFDQALDPETTAAVSAHCVACAACRAVFGREERLRQMLRELPAAAPPPGFAARVTAAAVERDRWQRQQRSLLYAGGLLAAGLALWVAVFFGHGVDPVTVPGGAGGVVTMALHQPRNIQLVVTAPRDIEAVTITIELPQGVNIVGLPSERQLSWAADLRQGRNLLTLPVVGEGAGEATLTARIAHGERSKTMQVKMLVRPEQLSGAAERLPVAA